MKKQNNNIMTWYAYRKLYDCQAFITVRKWNKINNNQVKNIELTQYLEKFYGKIGSKPKTVNKKINQKVIVITKNGFIKQFRLLSFCTLDIVKSYDIISNSFIKTKNDNAKSKITSYPIYDENFNEESEFLRLMFKKSSKMHIADIWDYEEHDKHIDILFKKNPFNKKKPNIDKTFIKDAIKKLNHVSKAKQYDIALKYYDYRYQIAYVLSDGKYHRLNTSFYYLFTIKDLIDGGFSW